MGKIIYLRSSKKSLINRNARVPEDTQEIKPKALNKGINSSSHYHSHYHSYLHSEIEEERRRIARELHDSLGHELLCINMDLLSLEEKIPGNLSLIRKKLRKIPKRLDKIINMMQKIITELRPELLDKLGLQAAMEWQAEEFKKRAGISCDHNFDISINFSKEHEISIFRIFQEALINIMRHAKATRVAINVKTTKHQFSMKITDNGKGIAAKQINNPQSYGIMAIKERASSLGGTLKIRGMKNGGTSVYLNIPLNTKANEYRKLMNH
jgi:signal transduction histidine kinase